MEFSRRKNAVYVCLLLFEEIPSSCIVVGLLGNLAYFLLLNDFPYFVIASPGFIGSVIAIIVNHCMAFSYFASGLHPFHEILAYFTMCLWIAPFAFFISLSANENVLPTMADRADISSAPADVVSNYFNRKGKKFGLLAFLKSAQENVLPQRVKKHF